MCVCLKEFGDYEAGAKDHKAKVDDFAKTYHENSVLHDDIDERDKKEAELKQRNKELNENLSKFEVIILVKHGLQTEIYTYL
jgi:hypothetical protein